MKSILTPVITLLVAASTALAQQLTVNTPSQVTFCEPVLITFSGGTLPYTLSILPGAQPDGTPLFTFPKITGGTSLTWLVNIAAGTSIGLTLRDSTGTIAQSAAFTILANTAGGTCDTASFSFSGQTAAGSNSGSTGSGSTGSGSTSPATTFTTEPLTKPATTATTGSTGSAKAGGSSLPASATSASATSTKSAGASRTTGQIAAAGIIGAAMVALFG